MEKLSDNESVTLLRFVGGSYNNAQNDLPYYPISINLKRGQSIANVVVSVEEEALLSDRERGASGLESVSSEVGVSFHEYSIRGSRKAVIEITPVYKRGSSVYKVSRFSIKVNFKKNANAHSSAIRSSYADNSVLSGGTWYKIPIAESGVYKIDANYLRSLNIDPTSVNISSMRIYGNGGGMIPEDNTTPRADDLVENAILVQGSDAGVGFGENDVAYFYGQSAHEWRLNGSKFAYIHNLYSDTNYYFLTFDGGVGSPKRIPVQSDFGSTTPTTVNTFNDYNSHELDLTNLIASGRQWLGENFGARPSLYVEFDFPNIVNSATASVDIALAMRSINSVSSMDIGVAGLGSTTISGGQVGGGYLDAYARNLFTSITGNPAQAKMGVSFTFNKANSESIAWLDRIVVNCVRNLTFTGSQMHFRYIDQRAGFGDYKFSVGGITALQIIWDITDPANIKSQSYSVNFGRAEFHRPGGNIEQFVAFSPLQVPVPNKGWAIGNQNLHAVAASHPQMVIFSPAEFLGYAEEVAELHREEDKLTVEVLDVQKVYNEFSSGRQDLGALRDFMRMLYKQAGGDSALEPRYLLLFGDASYDFKDRVTGNTNFIPIYQYPESFRPTGSIATDDFVAMLADDFNPSSIDKGIVMLGVGRLPVKTNRQAAAAVNKIKSYNTSASLGKWRTELAYIGDDEDGGLHMRQASGLADTVDFLYPDYNALKILSDAYPERSTPGGQRYPDVNRLIDQSVLSGALTLNYVGHGGELGWAHERILEVSQINKWSNITNMPLFVTATCEFSRFDDPKRTSAGEFVFLNPDGGGLGLLTTTRVVYASPNYALAQAFNQIAFRPYNGEMPRLGDIVKQTKVRPNNLNNNARAFALLGDPALKLNYPEHNIVTTSRPDTIGSLQTVTIEGEIRDSKSGALKSDFNGTVFPTVYDKKKDLKTLGNGGQNQVDFRARTNILFRGKVTVSGGKFSFSFVVPRDIDLNFGLGKISYYAHNGSIDAAGSDTLVVVGGQVGDPTSDQTGPTVDLFMNDTTFVVGGMTDENPSIYAQLFDENGINTSGSGIGHDISAVLDENTKDELVLNDYYEAVLNSYQRGVVKYPFEDLSEGKHTLTLRAWDVYNNSGTDKTEFIVSKGAKLALAHVLNYPNPFTTKTEFFFEHNYPETELAVRIQIFTVSGKIVKTIDGYYNSTGFRIGPIPWDGRDDFGDKIGRGTYIYRVEVKASNGETAKQFEKLVILN